MILPNGELGSRILGDLFFAVVASTMFDRRPFTFQLIIFMVVEFLRRDK
tara:strand:+ start:286 stop:432 length:147 start_codon:yes stop_codon:yes gene_type:complete